MLSAFYFFVLTIQDRERKKDSLTSVINQNTYSSQNSNFIHPRRQIAYTDQSLVFFSKFAKLEPKERYKGVVPDGGEGA